MSTEPFSHSCEIVGSFIERDALWPYSGLWVHRRLFVGIEMLLNGWSLVVLSLTARNLPEEEMAPQGLSERSEKSVEG